MKTGRRDQRDGGRGEQSRKDLIFAAALAFAENGISGASTRDIAKAAGVNVAAIGYHFGGKDALYRAVIEHIVNIILMRIGDTLEAAEEYLADSVASPDTALTHIQAILSASILSHTDIADLSQIIAHEQAKPTEAFDLLYEGVLKQIQVCGASLVARYVGDPTVSLSHIIRFHALLGEALAFRYAKQVFLKRIGEDNFDDAKMVAIQEILSEHAQWILDGLRSEKGRRLPGTKGRSSGKAQAQGKRPGAERTLLRQQARSRSRAK